MAGRQTESKALVVIAAPMRQAGRLKIRLVMFARQLGTICQCRVANFSGVVSRLESTGWPEFWAGRGSGRSVKQPQGDRPHFAGRWRCQGEAA